MVNRPAGGARSAKHLRAHLDWYVEPPRAVEQFFHGMARAGVSFDDDLIWDGCCGGGTVLEVARRYGHEVFGSDREHRRGHRFPFLQHNILKLGQTPEAIRAAMARGRRLSYVSNPPYGYVKDIAEHIMRHVIETFPVRRAAFLVPIAFLASEGRHRLFTRDIIPSHVCVHSQRVTCPPGDRIDQMADPFEGGMADYVWIVFTRPHRWRTQLVWLPPGNFPERPRRPKPKED
jgi:hypothetical protein